MAGEVLNSYIVFFSRTKNINDDFFDFLNSVSKLKDSSFEMSCVESLITLAESPEEGKITEDIMKLVPKVVDNPDFQFEPNALIRIDSTVKRKEEYDTAAKKALDYLMEQTKNSENRLDNIFDASSTVSAESVDTKTEAAIVPTEIAESEMKATEETSSDADDLKESSADQITSITVETEAKEIVDESVAESEIPVTVGENTEKGETEDAVTDEKKKKNKEPKVIKKASKEEKALEDAQRKLRANDRTIALKEAIFEFLDINESDEAFSYKELFLKLSVKLEEEIKGTELPMALLFAEQAHKAGDVYNRMAMVLHINAKLAEIRTNKIYREWVSKQIPKFVEAYPETAVTDLLNVFREESKRF